MSSFGPPYSGPSKTHYLYVDAGSLRGRLDHLYGRFFGSQTYTIDFRALVGEFTKVFYYDAVPVQLDGEDKGVYEIRVKPIVDILDAAASVDRMHVYEGDVRKRRKRNEQKKVDVMIAVDMLTHAFRRNMHEATLLTGDNDFKPLIDALVHDGMLVTLWYPPDETSKELLNAADLRRPLNMRSLQSLLSVQSRATFDLPFLINKPPVDEPGQTLKEWHDDGLRHTLNQEGADYIVLKDGNSLNRLHIRHQNLDLLTYYCKESLGIILPDA